MNKFEDYRDFDIEMPSDRTTRKARAAWLNSGSMGSNGLTARETALLDNLRLQGLEIRRTWLIQRSGAPWQHRRVVEYA